MKRFFTALAVLTICTMAFGFGVGSHLTETAFAKPGTPYLQCPYFPNDCVRGGAPCTYTEVCGENRDKHVDITTDGHCASTPNCCGAVINVGPCQ